MNPHQKNKIDVSVSTRLPRSTALLNWTTQGTFIDSLSCRCKQALSPEEQRLFRLYGKLPNRTDHLRKTFQERKYFDSGDYAMEKAGKGDGVDTGNVGSEHPVPENIRHNSVTSPPVLGLTKGGSISGPSGSVPVGSPAKESGLQRETSAEEAVVDEQPAADAAAAGDQQQQGIPIRNS